MSTGMPVVKIQNLFRIFVRLIRRFDVAEWGNIFQPGLAIQSNPL
jgi:hypothetical protein